MKTWQEALSEYRHVTNATGVPADHFQVGYRVGYEEGVFLIPDNPLYHLVYTVGYGHGKTDREREYLRTMLIESM